VFGIILLSVVTVMHVYAFWRADSVPFLKRSVPRKTPSRDCISLWAAFSLSRFLSHDNAGALAWALEVLGMNWMAVIFLITVSLLAVDLITGFGFLLLRLCPGCELCSGCRWRAFCVRTCTGSETARVQNYDVAPLRPSL